MTLVVLLEPIASGTSTLATPRARDAAVEQVLALLHRRCVVQPPGV